MKNAQSNPQLYELVRPIPDRYIKKPPSGKYGTYVPHYVIAQRILAIVGPYDWELVEIIRGDSSGNVDRKPVEKTDVIVGAVYRLTVEIDGETVVIEEIGENDSAYMEKTDAGRLKKASSDALKRCAMRLGIAIHLWCKTTDEFFLPRVLWDAQPEKTEDEEPDQDVKVLVGVEEDEDVPEEPDVPDAQDDEVARVRKQLEAVQAKLDDKPPASVEEAEENLRQGGLLGPEAHQVALPHTGEIVPRPATEGGWSVLAKKQFVAHSGGNAEQGAALYAGMARWALTELRGMDGTEAGGMSNKDIGAVQFTEEEVLRMLGELAV